MKNSKMKEYKDKIENQDRFKKKVIKKKVIKKKRN